MDGHTELPSFLLACLPACLHLHPVCTPARTHIRTHIRKLAHTSHTRFESVSLAKPVEDNDGKDNDDGNAEANGGSSRGYIHYANRHRPDSHYTDQAPSSNLLTHSCMHHLLDIPAESQHKT